MNKLIQLSILFALFLFTDKANAQITISYTNMPASGDTIRYSTCKATSVNYTVTGANMVWNYDTLVSTGQGLYDYQPSSATPYFFYFIGDYGLKVADSIGTGTFQLKKVYDFYKNSTATFETKGIGFQYSGIPLAANYTAPDEIYVFPLTYLNHDSTPYKVVASISTTTLSFAYAQYGYRITDVDGWGTIKTPFDTVGVPCIRVVSTTYGKDSINYNGIGIPIADVQRSYKWLSLTEKIPVLEVDGRYTAGSGAFTPTSAKFRDTYKYVAGIKQNEGVSYKVSVFPNPTSGDLFVYANSAEVSTVNVYDVSGVLVGSYKINDLITKVSLQNLAKGCYYYSVTTKQGMPVATGKVMVVN